MGESNKYAKTVTEIYARFYIKYKLFYTRLFMSKKLSLEDKVLHATIVLELPKSRSGRQLAKVQLSSLLRYFLAGDIVVWRNFSEPLYSVARAGVFEFDFTPKSALRKNADLIEITQEAKLRLAKSLLDYSSDYTWIILSDVDTLALRNWDHLFDDDSVDLLVSNDENGEFDNGFFAVRASIFGSFVDVWSSLKVGVLAGTSNYLQAIIETGNFVVCEFERGEVVRPFEKSSRIRELFEGSVVRLSGGRLAEKTKLAFALHMMRTFGDRDGIFLDLFES